MRELAEVDWKYMRNLKPTLLNALCQRINAESLRLLTHGAGTPHERYQELYDHIQQSDGIIADCFDDWRRSTLFIKIGFLLQNDLLPDEDLLALTAETQEIIKVFYQR